jgi:hypothetical protein
MRTLNSANSCRCPRLESTIRLLALAQSLFAQLHLTIRAFRMLVSSADHGSRAFSIDLAILLAFVPERILNVSREEVNFMRVEGTTLNQLLGAPISDDGVLLVELVALMIASRARKGCGCAKFTLLTNQEISLTMWQPM